MSPYANTHKRRSDVALLPEVYNIFILDNNR